MTITVISSPVVYTCKLSDREHPLYLRLVAGPKMEMLSFVLREHETGEVMVCYTGAVCATSWMSGLFFDLC